jgi:predicted RecA/RadA family phage recombinase
MPSQLHMLFGYGPPRMFAARNRNGRALVLTVPSTDPQSFYDGSVVRGGDYVSVGRTSMPGGYEVDMAADGIAVIKAGNDRTRQTVQAELYSRRLQLWTGDSTQFVNNNAPVGILQTLNLTLGVTMQPLFVLELFDDADGDVLTFDTIDGDLPPGTLYANGAVQGTPSDLGSGTFRIIANDPALAFGIAQVDWIVSPAPPPPPKPSSLMEYIRTKTAIGGSLTGN